MKMSSEASFDVILLNFLGKLMSGELVWRPARLLKEKLLEVRL